jgi:hypothetical protein
MENLIKLKEKAMAERAEKKKNVRDGRFRSSGFRKPGYRPRTQIRFLDVDHHTLIADAADQCGMSLNSWLVRVTMKAARKQLAGAAKEGKSAKPK